MVHLGLLLFRSSMYLFAYRLPSLFSELAGKLSDNLSAYIGKTLSLLCFKISSVIMASHERACIHLSNSSMIL